MATARSTVALSFSDRGSALEEGVSSVPRPSLVCSGRTVHVHGECVPLDEAGGPRVHWDSGKNALVATDRGVPTSAMRTTTGGGGAGVAASASGGRGRARATDDAPKRWSEMFFPAGSGAGMRMDARAPAAATSRAVASGVVASGGRDGHAGGVESDAHFHRTVMRETGADGDRPRRTDRDLVNARWERRLTDGTAATADHYTLSYCRGHDGRGVDASSIAGFGPRRPGESSAFITGLECTSLPPAPAFDERRADKMAVASRVLNIPPAVAELMGDGYTLDEAFERVARGEVSRSASMGAGAARAHFHRGSTMRTSRGGKTYARMGDVYEGGKVRSSVDHKALDARIARMSTAAPVAGMHPDAHATLYTREMSPADHAAFERGTAGPASTWADRPTAWIPSGKRI